MSTWDACANCGRDIRHVYDAEGDGWRHTVEPIGHEGVPSKEATIGRARAIEDIRRQMEFEVERGKTVDLAWFRRWLDYIGQPSILSTVEQDNLAFAGKEPQP